MAHIKSGPVRTILAAVLTLVSLLALAAGPGAAFAGLGGCRTDPIILLSNGRALQLPAQIDTNINNVQSVIYTVHAPIGTFPVLILYTDNPLRNVERVVFRADSLPGRYSSETIVDTTGSNTAVVATGLLVDALGRPLTSRRTAGREDQQLRLSFNP
jgi:hypothetical protein